MISSVEAISISEEFNTDGHRPLLILCNDYNLYVVKNSRGIIKDYQLTSEFLCNGLLFQWGIETPECCNVNVPKELISNSYSSYNRPHYFNDVCFGSKFSLGALELQNFIGIKGKKNFKKFQDPDTIFKIGLFDLWTENDDRKPTNYNILLRNDGEKFNLVAIDHAYTFSTMSYANLDPQNGVCQSFNDSILMSEFALDLKKQIKINKKWVDFYKDYFYLCVSNCRENYQQIINELHESFKLSETDSDRLYAFLFNENRNENVFREFLSRLK